MISGNEISYTYVLCQARYFYSNPAWNSIQSLYDGAGEVISSMTGNIFALPNTYLMSKWYVNWAESEELYWRYYATY